MKNNKTIEYLVSKAKIGDMKAENELFSYLHARFLPIVQHRIYSNSKDYVELKKDVEDITQQAMETIFRKYQNENFISGFTPWAYKILRNKIGDYLTDKKRESNTIRTLEKHDTTDNNQLEKKILAEELEENIINAIKKLGADSQSIILSLLKGYSVHNIADMLENIPRGTLDSKIHRCREKLKKILKKRGLI